MHREMNKNDFYLVRRAYDDAQELYDNGYFKEALFELKPALHVLERDAVMTRMLAKAKVLQARSLMNLSQNQKALSALEKAEYVLQVIGDHSEMHQEIADLKKQCKPAQSD